MENGIVAGTEIEDSASGRLHSHWGVFAPWPDRNQVQNAMHQDTGTHHWWFCTFLFAILYVKEAD